MKLSKKNAKYKQRSPARGRASKGTFYRECGKKEENRQYRKRAAVEEGDAGKARRTQEWTPTVDQENVAIPRTDPRRRKPANWCSQIVREQRQTVTSHKATDQLSLLKAGHRLRMTERAVYTAAKWLSATLEIGGRGLFVNCPGTSFLSPDPECLSCN